MSFSVKKNRVLHLSGNVFNPLNSTAVSHTEAIWCSLAKNAERYFILARNTSNHFSVSRKGNVVLILLPRIHRRQVVFFPLSFIAVVLIPFLKVDTVLSQSSLNGGLSGILSSKLFRIKALTEIHGNEYFTNFHRNNLKSKLQRFVFNNSTKVRSLNSLMTKKLLEAGVTSNIVEVPTRVNFSLFDNPKSSFDLSGGVVNLVSVGRFVKEKNYLNLIKVLSKWDVDFHLTLIGGGPQKVELLNLIDELGLGNSVKLVEWIQQKRLVTLIKDSDIYIQSSISEGMPRSLLEAMALRMPIISTNVGFIPGFLNDADNALLIAPDLSTLIQHLDTLIKSEKLRIELARRAYYKAFSDYEWNKNMNIYRDFIYR